ncbi:MAG TPA: hypothetical protein VI299_28430 [Polyangiales bacterium]
MFQLILPFQLELPFEAEAAPSARGGGGALGSLPRTARARRPRRESQRKNLAFEFGALEEE